MDPDWRKASHPDFSRRQSLQAGAVGILGLGMNHLAAFRQSADAAETRVTPRRSVIFIFLSGGLAQQDSFDPKPLAPDNVRGEFSPISTRTTGLSICEHLPMLAARSQLWSVVRSLTHPYNGHSQGHMSILSGRTELPPRFSSNKPGGNDWPSIASVAGAVTASRNNLPPAVALPERLIHRTGRVIPGQFGGVMGDRRDPWFIEASPFNGTTYGAYPSFEFHHQKGKERHRGLQFQAPNLSLPEGLDAVRIDRRLDLLRHIELQRTQLDQLGSTQAFDRHREAALSLLTGSRVREAFDVVNADARTLERYGRNSFGWSLLMARRLVQSGVNLVQVNLGNNETWDTHGNAFPNLKNYLFPPTDRAISALLDDLNETGMLHDTLVVVASEFGRTPKITKLSVYDLPGRDHWGAVQSVLLAGGGVQGGRIIGSSDKVGGDPASDPQMPENLAATIYQSLGIPQVATWPDDLGRPHHVYHGDPIRGLA